MNHHHGKCFAAAVFLAVSGAGHQALGQQQSASLREQLIGTWTLQELHAVTWDEDDRNPFGSSPRGKMILDGKGNVTVVIVGADRRHFVLGDRLLGTPEENRSVVHSIQAFFGTYRVGDDNQTVVFQIERSSYPNWDGTFQMSVMTINGDMLDQTKAGPRASWGYATWIRESARQVVQTD